MAAIVSAYSEIEIYEKEIHRAVESPTTVLSGRDPDEEWLYLEGPGRTEGLKVSSSSTAGIVGVSSPRSHEE